MLRNASDSWGAPAKVFHWVMAALILAQIALGLMASNWRVSPTKIELFFWHKSTGMLILALVGLRILWRLPNSTPELPAGLTRRALAPGRLSRNVPSSVVNSPPPAALGSYSSRHAPISRFLPDL